LFRSICSGGMSFSVFATPFLRKGRLPSHPHVLGHLLLVVAVAGAEG
jgi:hypothetical protein